MRLAACGLRFAVCVFNVVVVVVVAVVEVDVVDVVHVVAHALQVCIIAVCGFVTVCGLRFYVVDVAV